MVLNLIWIFTLKYWNHWICERSEQPPEASLWLPKWDILYWLLTTVLHLFSFHITSEMKRIFRQGLCTSNNFYRNVWIAKVISWPLLLPPIDNHRRSQKSERVTSLIIIDTKHPISCNLQLEFFKKKISIREALLNFQASCLPMVGP